MHKEDPCSKFVSLHLSPECMHLNVRLYIELFDVIGRKQIDLLSENLIVEKVLKKRWVDGFSWISCLILYSGLKAGILL